MGGWGFSLLIVVQAFSGCTKLRLENLPSMWQSKAGPYELAGTEANRPYYTGPDAFLYWHVDSRWHVSDVLGSAAVWMLLDEDVPSPDFSLSGLWKYLGAGGAFQDAPQIVAICVCDLFLAGVSEPFPELGGATFSYSGVQNSRPRYTLTASRSLPPSPSTHAGFDGSVYYYPNAIGGPAWVVGDQMEGQAWLKIQHSSVWPGSAGSVPWQVNWGSSAEVVWIANSSIALICKPCDVLLANVPSIQTTRGGKFTLAGIFSRRGYYMNAEDQLLYYHLANSKWYVSDVLGSSSSGLRTPDTSWSPDLVKNQWKYYDGQQWAFDPDIVAVCTVCDVLVANVPLALNALRGLYHMSGWYNGKPEYSTANSSLFWHQAVARWIVSSHKHASDPVDTLALAEDTPQPNALRTASWLWWDGSDMSPDPHIDVICTACDVLVENVPDVQDNRGGFFGLQGASRNKPYFANAQDQYLYWSTQGSWLISNVLDSTSAGIESVGVATSPDSAQAGSWRFYDAGWQHADPPIQVYCTDCAPLANCVGTNGSCVCTACAPGFLPPQCELMPCPTTGYVGLSPSCVCDRGYTGCGWSNASGWAMAELQACPGDYTGTSPACQCARGYSGCGWEATGWLPGSVEPCPGIGYRGTSPECDCDASFSGCGWDPASEAWQPATECSAVAECRQLASDCNCLSCYVGYTLQAGNCVEAPCPTIGYTGSTPQCECAKGYVNCGWNGNGWNADTELLACPTWGYSTASQTPNCACDAGYRGCGWDGSAWVIPTVSDCPQGYSGASPDCVCSVGFTGCGFEAGGWLTPQAVACPAEGYTGDSPSCSCLTGFRGCGWANADWTLPTRVDCPNDGYYGSSPFCACLYGWVGCAWTEADWANAMAVPCPTGYEGQPGSCQCARGFVGCGWGTNNAWANAIGVPCTEEGYGSDCDCVPGYTDCGWDADRWLLPKVVPCPALGYSNVEAPACGCALGYGHCSWLGSTWSPASAVECPSTGGYTGVSPNCACVYGFEGCGWSEASSEWIAATAIPCPPGYAREAGQCSCAVGYAGCGFQDGLWRTAYLVGCPASGYTGLSPACVCKAGYTECGWSGTSWYPATLAACPLFGYASDSLPPACTCTTGYSDCVWSSASLSWTEATLLPCDRPGYRGTAPSCTCSEGYTGCGWSGAAWYNATVLSCPTLGYQGTPPHCSCVDGYAGCEWNSMLGTWLYSSAVACPTEGYKGSPGNCSCKPGYSGCTFTSNGTWTSATLISLNDGQLASAPTKLPTWLAVILGIWGALIALCCVLCLLMCWRKRRRVQVDEGLEDELGMGAQVDLDVWRCEIHETVEHDFYISYRGNNAPIARELYYMLQNELQARVFLDKYCLPLDGPRQMAVQTGLISSSVIVLLISQPTLDRMRKADSKPNNLLLEYELALERAESGLALLLLVFIDEEKGTDVRRCTASRFPDVPHAHPASRAVSVRSTMEKLLKLQDLHIVPSGADSVLPSARRILEAATDLRLSLKLQRAFGGPQRGRLQDATTLQDLEEALGGEGGARWTPVQHESLIQWFHRHTEPGSAFLTGLELQALSTALSTSVQGNRVLLHS